MSKVKPARQGSSDTAAHRRLAPAAALVVYPYNNLDIENSSCLQAENMQTTHMEIVHA
jgi:hypothetical protein